MCSPTKPESPPDGAVASAAVAPIRTFLAVELPADLRGALDRARLRLKGTRAHVGWVAPANLHLSLVFLGDIPADQVPGLAATLRARVAGAAPFSVEVTGVGHFGDGQSPRVVWAGVTPSAPLMALQGAVESGCRECGFAVEARPYHPHITLGRVRSSRGREVLMAEMQRLAGTAFGAMAVDAVALMRSHLQAGGPRYERLAALPLAAVP